MPMERVFHGAFSLWCRNSKAFCKRSFALQPEQPKRDKQNVHVVPLLEIFLPGPWLLSPFNKLCTTELKIKQMYTLFCSFTLFIFYSWMFNVINSSKMNNLKTIQEFSKTTRCFSRIKDITSLIPNSRTILGAQGRLATLRRRGASVHPTVLLCRKSG